MTGDIDDCYARLQKALPVNWFAGPIVSAVLYGAAWALSFCYALLAYIRLQTRLSTATDGHLDMIAGDFFGLGLPRNMHEEDASYRARIRVELFRLRATRPALALILTQLTGNVPTIIEPTRPGDCGGYGLPVMGYGRAGRYGSLACPWQAFVEVYRPRSIGALNVPGYGCAQSGYGAGSCYVAAGSLLNLTDQKIFAAVEAVRPVGARVWVRLVDAG